MFKVIDNVDLSKYSNWKIGGVAKKLIYINDIGDYKKAVLFCEKYKLSPVIVGNTTNLLFDNGYLDIALLKLTDRFSSIHIDDNQITVGSNIECHRLSRLAQVNGLKGLEHIVGIPATLGGLVYMNGGSKRTTISSSIISVTSVDSNGQEIVREANECSFEYRKSIFQEKKELITSVKLSLSKGSSSKIRRECLSILRDCRKKFPRKLPSCGSLFVSEPSMYNEFGPPGKIIESLGFKGSKVGGAMVSPIHANFIVNFGGAVASDVVKLVNRINERIHSEHGFTLKSEGVFVSSKGELIRLDDLSDENSLI